MESILTQSFTDFELIINDGLIDGSGAILRDLKAGRYRKAFCHAEDEDVETIDAELISTCL